MTTTDDREEFAVLTHFDVPAPRSTLIDDIVAAASAPPSTGWPRRAGNRLWMRRGTISAVAAIGLVSAAAGAASGWFGERIVNLPVISSIAKVIPDAVKAKPSHKPKSVPTKVVMPEARKETSPIIIAKPPEPAPKPPTLQLDMVPIKQTARAERIIDRVSTAVDRRDARRTANGRPVDTAAERAALEQLRAAKSAEDQKAAIVALKDLRESRRARFIEQRARRAARQMALPEQDRQRPFFRRPLCTPQQAARPRLNGCRRPRRGESDEIAP